MSVTIHCPQCDSGLKLPDRSLLGRKGKCPKCQHRFILEEPDEVELQLADPPTVPVPPPEPVAPLMGTSAKWVPDAPVSQDPVFPLANSAADTPTFPFADAAAPAFTVPSQTAPAFPTADPFVQAAAGSAPVPTGTTTNELEFAAPSSSTDAEGGTVASRVRGRRKRKGRKGPIVVGLGTLLFVGSMLGLWWQQKNVRLQEQQAAVNAQRPEKNEAWEEEKIELADSNEAATELSPTSGEVIPLEYLPFTPHLICHIRPSEIWGPDATSQEFVALSFDLGTWLAEKIVDITRFEPQEIEELTFALNFGARTSAPEVAAVVRLRSEQSMSDLQINRFKGQVRPDLESQVFESDRYSYMLIDNKTFAVAPVALSAELAEAKTYPRQPSVELEVLHRESDRSRWMSVLFDTVNVDTHREYIFGKDLQTFADSFVLWFGKDIRTVSWSFHLSNDSFFMETLLLPDNASSPLRAERHIRNQLTHLPESLVQMSRFMKPTSVGYRKLIGRFPAMLQATVLGTSTHVAPAFVRMVTLLPGKAAANLAAASLTTWHQTLVTDFTGPAPVKIAKGQATPETVAERLKMPVIVDFRRMPLQEAFSYISDEIKTPININGDALKLAGMTQNMPQTYNLGEIPALAAIDAMLSNPDYKEMLVIVVDENAKTIQLTTRVVATEAGLPIYNTK